MNGKPAAERSQSHTSTMDDSPSGAKADTTSKLPRAHRSPLPRWKRWLFRCLALLLSIFLLLAAEGLLRLLGVGVDLRLIVPVSATSDSGAVMLNPQADRRFHGSGDLPGPEPRPLTLPKPTDTYRILFLGGSTVIGYPYDPAIAFPRRVELLLNAQTTDGRRFEVVNAGMAAIDSRSIATLTPHLSRLENDLIVLHTGHNEYFGPGAPSATLPLPLTSALFSLRHWRLVQLLGGLRAAPVDTLIKNEQPRLLPDQNPGHNGSLEAASAQLRSNLRQAIAVATRENASVIVSGVASNLRDQGPWSPHDVPSLPCDDYPTVPEPDDTSAGFTFRRAHCAAQQDDAQTARELFGRARDLDPFPVRAPSSFASATKKTAGEFAHGVSFLSIPDAVAAAARDGIPGSDLFVDHVHYNQLGHHVVALAFARHIWESVLGNKWEANRVPSDEELSERLGITAEDEIAALSIIRETLRRPPLSDALDADLRLGELDETIRQLRNDLDERRRNVLRPFTSLEMAQFPEILSAAHQAAGHHDLADEFALRAQRRRPWSAAGGELLEHLKDDAGAEPPHLHR